MGFQKWSDVRKRNLSPERLAKNTADAMAEILEMELREVRELAGLTQAETAEAASMEQGTISKLEKESSDRRISTVRRYVEALGGELEIVARIGNKTIRLRGL